MERHDTPAWRNLGLGLFFLASFVALLATLFIVGTNSHLFERRYELTLYVPNAQGLSKGAVVSLSGLEVGKVKDIQFARHDGQNMVRIDVSVARSRQRQITTSSHATIRTVGVLGDKFVDISLGDPSETPLEPGAVLPVMGMVDWTATFERASGVVDDLVELVQEGARAVGSLNEGAGALGQLLRDPTTAEHLASTLRDLSAVAGSLREGRGALGRLLHDPATAAHLDSVLTRLDQLTTRATSGSGVLARILSDERLGRHLAHMLTQADSLVSSARTGEGTAGKLLSEGDLYEELLASVEAVRALIKSIKADPQRYLSISLF